MRRLTARELLGNDAIILVYIIVGRKILRTVVWDSFSGHRGLDIQLVTQDFSLKQLTSGFYPLVDSPLGSSAGFLIFNLEIR